MSNSEYPFFDEFMPPAKKDKKPAGLQNAKAMYHSTNRYGYRLFNDTQNFNALIELAQGRQSTENIYKSLGFFNDKGATQDDNGALAYIDVQVLNLVTKYVNRAVAKLQRYRYDVNFSAVDPISVDQAKQRNAQIKALYEMKDWMERVKVDPQQIFPDIDVSLLPDFPDEMMFNLMANSKVKKIVDAEKTLKLVNHTLNDVDEEMRLYDWDSVVVGRGHIHCYNDHNNLPRIKRINPKFWGGSYVDNEDFSKQEYAFFIDFISRNQFKTEAQGDLSQAEMEEVIGAFAFPNTAASFGSSPEYYDNYDGLEYIPVMRFYFLSNDNVAYKIWNHNDTGNRQIEPTHYQYFSKSKTKEVVQNSYTSVYGGVWVVDSETVYNYGRKDIPKTMLVNSRLPIVTFAPSMKEGRVVSLVAQLVEPADLLNVAWNRLKDILAKGRMGVLELNLTAIENIALGRGGENWTPREAIDFFMQSNIWVTRQNTNQFGQNLGKSLQESNAGLTVADYLSTITTAIRMMDEQSGSTIVESAQVPDRVTTGTVKANMQSGTEAIEYLVNGHLQTYKQVCHLSLLLAQESKRSNASLQGMIPALGTSTTEFFEVPEDLPYTEFGLQMIPEPTQEEWIDFFTEMQLSVREGRLNSSDSAFIRQIKSMTLARYIMAVRERSNEAKNMKLKAQDQQFQMQMAGQATQDKLQSEMALLQEKKKIDIEVMAIQARIDDALLQRKAMLEGEVSKVSDMVKQQITRQTGIDTVLKEAMRSRSEDNKAQQQHDSKLLAANIGAQATLAAAEISAKNKPKPAAGK